MKRSLSVIAVAGLLALFWWMATSVSDSQSTTADEIAHLTAGYSYWTTNDYRLQPENGNLPQRWAALPLLNGSVTFPTLDQYAWRTSDVWDLGFQWFYTQGNDLARMLREGRRMIALFGVACGLLVFLWGRRLHGTAGGLLALTLFAFCPTVLANGALVTSDMTACCLFLATAGAFWMLAHRVSIARILGLGITLGLLSVSKFSAPLIVPMVVLMAAARLARPEPLPVSWPLSKLIAGNGERLVALVVASAAAAAIAVAIIWASYGFRYSMHPPSEHNPVRNLVGWDVIEDQPSPVVTVLRFARAHELLPESYLYGFAHTWRFSRYRKAFLNGDYRSTGWVQFFPYTTLVKTPLPLFGLLGLAGILGLTRLRRERAFWGLLYPWTPLASLVLVYWAFALTSGLNIGHRHLLPVYPVYFLVAAGAIRWVCRSTAFAGACVVGLTLWFVGESISIRPHYLAYFNELVGPRNAWHHVVDSSLDWGQDLPSAKAWLDKNARGRPVFISYFGSGDPLYYGIDGTRIGDDNFELRPRRYPSILRGGVWLISVTMFQQVYSRARGHWDVGKEAVYQNLLKKAVETAQAGGKLSVEDGKSIEEYQFARLCHFLRNTPPLAQPGYTFLVFELTDDEVNRALYSPLRTL